MPVWSTWQSVIGGVLSGATYREPTTQQCGRRRAKTRGIVLFSRTTRWVGALRGRKAQFNRDIVSNKTAQKRTLPGLEAAPGRIFFFRQNPNPHWYSQPWRSCGIASQKNDCLIFILTCSLFFFFLLFSQQELPIYTDSLWWTPLP